MAGNNIDIPSSFSIEETMDLGIGNTELIRDLMAPESASGNPDELEPVVSEVADDKPPKDGKKPVRKGGKEKPEETVSEETAGEKEDNQSLISDFLEKGEDEETTVETSTKKEVDASENETPSQFTALAKDLYKLGVFTQDEGEEEPDITNAEEFLEKF